MVIPLVDEDRWCIEVLSTHGKKKQILKAIEMMQNGKGQKGAKYLLKKGVMVEMKGDDKYITLNGKPLKPTLNEYLEQIKE